MLGAKALAGDVAGRVAWGRGDGLDGQVRSHQKRREVLLRGRGRRAAVDGVVDGGSRALMWPGSQSPRRFEAAAGGDGWARPSGLCLLSYLCRLRFPHRIRTIKRLLKTIAVSIAAPARISRLHDRRIARSSRRNYQSTVEAHASKIRRAIPGVLIRRRRQVLPHRLLKARAACLLNGLLHARMQFGVWRAAADGLDGSRRLARIASDHRDQIIERLRQAGERDGAQQHGVEPGVGA